jgi:hypothetical protein
MDRLEIMSLNYTTFFSASSLACRIDFSGLLG